MPEELTELFKSLDARLRIQEVWAAEHDGRINTLWEAQENTNKRMKADMDTQSIRTSQLEHRFVFIVAFACAVGSTVGGLFTFGLLSAWTN